METMTKKKAIYFKEWRKELLYTIISAIILTLFVCYIKEGTRARLTMMLLFYFTLVFIKLRIIDRGGFCPVRIEYKQDCIEMTVIKLTCMQRIIISPADCLIKRYDFETKVKSYIILFPSKQNRGGYIFREPIWSLEEQESILQQMSQYDGITIQVIPIHR